MKIEISIGEWCNTRLIQLWPKIHQIEIFGTHINGCNLAQNNMVRVYIVSEINDLYEILWTRKWKRRLEKVN